MLNIIRLFCVGIAVGMANVIPGVSGGTLAVVFNVYDQFINAITFNVKNIWQNRRFVFPMLGGMALGVLIFSKLISLLYSNFPFQTNCFFTGLILGSIPLLYSLMIRGGKKNDVVSTGSTTAEADSTTAEADSATAEADSISEDADSTRAGSSSFSVARIISLILCALAGFALIMVFFYLEKKFDKASIENMILPDWTVMLAVRIFIAGFIGAIAMIIPGISGSLLMLMMGVYTIIITAIPALFEPSTFTKALFLLLPNGVGVLLGLLCGAKAISLLFEKLPYQTYAVIFGLICGSVFVIFPGWTGFAAPVSCITSVLCILAGAAMSFFSAKFEPKSN